MGLPTVSSDEHLDITIYLLPLLIWISNCPVIIPIVLSAYLCRPHGLPGTVGQLSGSLSLLTLRSDVIRLVYVSSDYPELGSSRR